MAKYALLIGTSEYQSQHIKPLKGVIKDIEAMRRVLQDKKISGFDDVQLLLNSDSNAVRSHIEQLFMEKSQKDDTVLLYFSGHGYRYEDGNLFFISHNTETNSQGKPRIGTAVRAKSIHEDYMSRSKAKRQVLILDCCFSGAFAKDMNAKEIVLVSIKDEIEQQLGGEGRAVLTSSTSTQPSFEDAGGGIYTQYLVEGIETGAADADNDGVITVDELHQYAKRKVREAKPAMQPEIYAVREGYGISLANVSVSRPELEYRKEVEECVKYDEFSVENNSFTEFAREHLTFEQEELGLDPELAKRIEEDVLQPIRLRYQNLQKYEKFVSLKLRGKTLINNGVWNIFKRRQERFGLRDEDVAPIHQRLIPQQSTQKQPPKQTLPDEDDLSSEKGIDYSKLRDLLKAQNWKEADQETYTIMQELAETTEKLGFQIQDINRLPNREISSINNLWVKFSDEVFGFSIQKSIYEREGKDFTKFAEKVGWKKKEWPFWNEEKYIFYPEDIYAKCSTGCLPASWLLISTMSSKKASTRGRWRERIFDSIMEKV